MARRNSVVNLEELEWHEDLAIWRSWNGAVPWKERFGQGKLKVLSYDLETQAGTYLWFWPPGYDPLGHHGHGGDAEYLILEGELRQGEDALAAGTYMYLQNGQKHGPFVAGPQGCIFQLSVSGPVFDQEFIRALLEAGRAPRFRA